jgi:hypothetical protein
MSSNLTSLPEKIIITGTGRAGTTFLIRLLTLLSLPTGFKPNQVGRLPGANAGMELKMESGALIVKNPEFIRGLDFYSKKYSLFVIIPVREMKESAKSRVKNGRGAGGVWNASTEEQQINWYNHIMTKGLVDIIQNDIPHVFIDFNRMIRSSEYLYDKLSYVMNKFNISYETFCVAYEKASDVSRPVQAV